MKVYVLIQHPTGVLGVYSSKEAAWHVAKQYAEDRAPMMCGRVVESSNSIVVKFPKQIALYVVEQEVQE